MISIQGTHTNHHNDVYTPLPRTAPPAHIQERRALLHHHSVVVAAGGTAPARRVLPGDDGDLLDVVPLVGARPELADDLVDLLDLSWVRMVCGWDGMVSGYGIEPHQRRGHVDIPTNARAFILW